ncbi:uncharacterized protein LOC133834102 [Humulus lupulus]|uniref:uncharacterized protein LOC133834102 n=1 Tax=Humulus lupulus TaxID=3486 RepID=UPI002B40D197|nr:uncharacterized protein LOC133834102 [Humulus lupulus]
MNMDMDTEMIKEEKEKEDNNGVGATIWDCGSPLYDSYELASMGHLLQKHTMLPFFSSSTSNGRRLINMADHQERFKFGSGRKISNYYNNKKKVEKPKICKGKRKLDHP